MAVRVTNAGNQDPRRTDAAANKETRVHTKTIIAASIMATCASGALAGSYQKTASGVVVKPDTGASKEVRLEVMNGDIIHVVKVDAAGKAIDPSLMAVAAPATDGFTVRALGKDGVELKAARISATVSLKDGKLTFRNANGAPILTQYTETMEPVSIGGKPFLAVKEGFNAGTPDAFYGLGQHQNHQMNLNGEDVLLQQHNIDVAVPFLVSDKNYGILWDNNGISRFGNPKPYGWLSRDLTLTGDDGKSAGLTARYYVGDKLVLTRQEKDIAYQYVKDLAENWPKELGDGKHPAANTRVVWSGNMTSRKDGVHKMQLYVSDYATLTVDGRQVMDVWRQGWNPWYRNFDVNFTADKPVPVKLEWKPSGGMVAMTHSDPLPAQDRHSLTFSSEVAQAINYYVIGGSDIDNVIAGYRHITGAAPMMPKWAYGFWQSRQRYETQDQLLGVLSEYRKNGWPIDNMVQDWFYWPENGWGSHQFDKVRFPDPKGLVDAVHAQHAHIMLSVWGKFYANTDNYRELESKGHMWTRNVENGDLDWVGRGYKNSHYDPYTKEARDIYYRQLKPVVDLGFDAWWMDNTEPDVQSNSRLEDFKKLIGPTVHGAGEVTFNTYSLVHSGGMYGHLKADQPDKRQFILSRSGYAGIQRNATAVWSGDVASRWSDLADQIAAGVSFSMSGIPNWTHDIGGYAQEVRFQNGDVGAAQENRSVGQATARADDLKEWQELNLRWFQFGAFSPLFRSHGEVVKREINLISPEGSPMRESMVWHDQLRYRLMPYIYTTASDTYYSAGTIMRGLVMDFPDDDAVKDVKDQYLFGRAIMVAPVTVYGARERSVYMPKGASWYDFHTGAVYQGGTHVTMKAPFERMPLLVRAGAIVPMGPVMQYVDEHPDAPITLRVYTGADGRFTLYEDDGVSNGYTRGEASRIPVSYDDKTRTVTIGQRSGSYKGMVGKRVFKVHFIKPGVSTSGHLDDADKSVDYDGKPVTIRL
jgi:alpha-D-xyloside xylohydrolase